MEPGTWAAIAATAAASAGVGAVGAIQQGRAAQAAGEFNAQVGMQQAAREKQIAGLQAEQFTRSQQALLAKSRAARLASGVSYQGTPTLLDDQAVDEIAYNEALIRSGGEVKATRLEQEAALSRFGGRSARTSGMFRAGQSLLQGAYSAAAPFATYSGSNSGRTPLKPQSGTFGGPEWS